MERTLQYWLMKSEPDVFGIADLRRLGRSPWDGVRNYQARNHLMAMQVGDRVLFHHSSADPSGIAGLARVVTAAYPDHTAWDTHSDYYDAKSTPETPRWMMVDVAFEAELPRLLTLAELRQVPELASMILLNNSRLSVQPVTAEQFRTILALGAAPSAVGAAVATAHRATASSISKTPTTTASSLPGANGQRKNPERSRQTPKRTRR